ncbi:putative oxidoreductase, aryl-alcohol dehydrogenase like protein [Planoprotostelium fungivorum]|uniref:Putative oxidoreductase, aryl-alcohol dehydrogenase like protein n=1 Tax=Planoprotostelium fungivorum TaxID=1890364 RepID=A0A2P6NAX3_9EUKA|nr:putative oxidoreductase, aryl-alcohol dehydrogenase like protein [Planoprotostelium fungivorum]
MSGYLPPHTKEGPASKLFEPEYTLRSQNHERGPRTHHRVAVPKDIIPTVDTMIQIGTKEKPNLVEIPPIGFGLWGWGDVISYGWGPSGGYDQNLDEKSVAEAFDTILKHFPTAFFDVAEHYGYTDGFAESIFGVNFQEKMRAHRDRIVLASKFLPTPWRHPWMYPDVTLKSLEGSIIRTKLGRIDIYQLHGPSHFGFWPKLSTLCEALCLAYQTGSVGGIGVCNLSVDQTEYVWKYLKERDVPMVSSQIEFSLVRMDPLLSGHIRWCHERNITVIAYSPLAVGRLTGKYSSINPPRGNRNFGHIMWSKIDPIIKELKRIGEKMGKTPAAVALNWVICKGAVPIPTAKNGKQVEDAVAALGWRLSPEDENALDDVGVDGRNTWDYNLLKHFQNWWWQQG